MNAYRVLGLHDGASIEAVRSAYRALARRHHPDAVGGCHETFLLVQAAYRVLTDPDERTRHALDPDATLKNSLAAEQRRAQLSRRRSRLRRLYD
ncbi:MAG: J domain-containing protein [Myxococcota bacterium]